MSASKQMQHQILHGPVGPTLLELAAPTVIGIAAIMLFNVVDTFWVGQLGARELSAMTFTFPVAMIVFSISMGVGIGATSVIARALGSGAEGEVRRLTTDALLLANVAVVIVALGGLATLDPLFTLLGADEPTLVLIRQYMVPWYMGVGLLVIPMVGNSAIRATGDTRTPSYIMLVAGLVNAALDPFLIFGWGPFPRLELQGAALSTVGSYAGAFCVALWILGRRERLITLERVAPSAVLASWRRILYIGLPAAATNMLGPVSSGILIRMVADYGALPVAAYGVGTRIEGLAMIGVAALSTAVTPVVAQNLGAMRADRIRGTVLFALKAALVWGLGVALVLGLGSRWLAERFNTDLEVVTLAAAYLVIVPVSLGGLGAAQIVGTALNALGQPLRAAGLVATRLMLFAVPFAWVGARFSGVRGIFVGIAAANALIGAVAFVVAVRRLRALDAAMPAPSVG